MNALNARDVSSITDHHANFCTCRGGCAAVCRRLSRLRLTMLPLGTLEQSLHRRLSHRIPAPSVGVDHMERVRICGQSQRCCDSISWYDFQSLHSACPDKATRIVEASEQSIGNPRQNRLVERLRVGQMDHSGDHAGRSVFDEDVLGTRKRDDAIKSERTKRRDSLNGQIASPNDSDQRVKRSSVVKRRDCRNELPTVLGVLLCGSRTAHESILSI